MDGEGSTTLNVKSELEFPSIPNDIVFPDELNRYLRDQIQYLLHENGMLKKHLSEKEIAMKNCAAQIESLSAKLKEYENSKEVNQFTQPETLASVKIVELGKKLREKNAEVGSLRTKCSKLEQKIVELTERELQSESCEICFTHDAHIRNSDQVSEPESGSEFGFLTFHGKCVLFSGRIRIPKLEMKPL